MLKKIGALQDFMCILERKRMKDKEIITLIKKKNDIYEICKAGCIRISQIENQSCFDVQIDTGQDRYSVILYNVDEVHIRTLEDIKNMYEKSIKELEEMILNPKMPSTPAGVVFTPSMASVIQTTMRKEKEKHEQLLEEKRKEYKIFKLNNEN